MFYYVKNLQGDITAFLSDEGFLVARYVYDDWGNCTIVGDSSAWNGAPEANPLRYRGYVYDNDTGLYYLQSRYYDPQTGRFISCDDVNYIGITESEVSYNPFAYCENDPVNDSDPSGYASLKYIAFGIQLCATVGKFTGGIELVFQKLNNKWTTKLYFFAGTTTSLDLKTNVFNVIYNKIKKKNKINLKDFANLGISATVFMILGNNKASLGNYTGWFSSGSIKIWRHIYLSAAISKNRKSGAIIGSLGLSLSSSNGIWSFSQTYYALYSKGNTLKNLLFSLRQDIYDKVAFMASLGALLL